MSTGIYAPKCWETKIATVPGTSSPRGRATLVIHHPIRDLSAHLASAAQRHRMLSLCLFTAPAWNSNPTPRERLGCADNAVATARELSWETRQTRGVPTPARSWGSPLSCKGQSWKRKAPGPYRLLHRHLQSPSPAGGSQRRSGKPLLFPGRRETTPIWPPGHPPPSLCPGVGVGCPPRVLTGSVLSAVSGVRGGATGQAPVGWSGGAGGGGCLSRAGCVSSASCRSRM